MKPGRSLPEADLAADKTRALALTPVSRETLARLERFVATLNEWQTTTSLVALSTWPHIWTRHVADALQILDIAPQPPEAQTPRAQTPQAQTWVDLGSGGGFPGLVVACALAERPGACVHLVESNLKKAAFLRAAVRATGAPAKVHAVRIADFARSFQGRADVVTARALAPLNDLLNHSFPLWTEGTVGLFPKGQDVEAELTEAARYWNIDPHLVPSRTDPKGRIVMIRVLQPRPQAQDGGG